MNTADPNIPLLEAIVNALGSLSERFAFVGGCTTGLLVTDPGAAPVRATRDVDVIVEVITLASYHSLERDLERAGLVHDRSPDAPVCRWILAGCLLDVMPTDERILGFGNRWFSEAIRSAQSVRLPSAKSIRVVTPPLFLATKLEALNSRGARDFLASHDLEDIINVVDGRPELVAEVRASALHLRTFIARRIGELLSNGTFLEALPAHLAGDDASQARLPLILERLGNLCL